MNDKQERRKSRWVMRMKAFAHLDGCFSVVPSFLCCFLFFPYSFSLYF